MRALGDGQRSAAEESTGRVKRIVVAILFAITAASIVALIFREGPLAADIRKERLVVDDTTRDYRIVVPHESVRPTPVVFSFHGVGDSADSMADYSRLDRIAAQNGFVLVYPAALNSMWTTIDVGSSNLEANPDVRFFDQLLAHLTSVYDVDRERIYLMGMSNGASFAQLLATARSYEIAAVVAHSGSRPQGLADSDPSLPIMLIVGRDDLAYSNMQTDADQYRLDGHTVEFINVPSLAHQWSTRHNNQMWQFLSRNVRPTQDLKEPSVAR